MHVAPGQHLRYAVQADDAVATPVVHLQGSDLVVRVPAAVVRAWAKSDDVGIEGAQEFGEHTLSVLVEKDFECLIPRTGQDGDAFPNPKSRGD